MRREDQSFDEILHLLSFSPKRRLFLFRNIPQGEQGFILSKISPRVQRAILERLQTREIVQFLHHVDFDKVARILRNVEPRRREGIIQGLKEEAREKVELLLTFGPHTAAGIMDLNYIIAELTDSLPDILRAAEAHERNTGKPPTILILKNGALLGEIPLHYIGVRSSTSDVSSLLRRVPSIRYDRNEREVLQVFREHPHSKIVVLDDDKSVLGVIYSHDILDLISESSHETFYGFAGVRREEDAFDSVIIKVKNRYGWLLLNLATAFLAASVVGLFEDTISRVVALVAYMPVVAGMGGNAATQTLAVVVRGLAKGEIRPRSGTLVLMREIGAGAINGFLIGLPVAIVSYAFGGSILLGFVVAVSILVNLIVASVFGTIVPLFMTRLHKDPASSASIFMTTATDVLGFFVFLGLAKLFL